MLSAADLCVEMIDLRLNGGGAFGLGFKGALKIRYERVQLGEALFDGSVELHATSIGDAFTNGLL